MGQFGGTGLGLNEIYAQNTLTASAGAETYNLINNKKTNIQNALPSGVNSTITLESPTSGQDNRIECDITTGATAPTLVYSGFTPIGDLPTFEADKAYTLYFEQTEISTGTWVVKMAYRDWGAYV